MPLGVSSSETFLYAGVVNAQELVLGGNHVNKIWLALGALLVQELVHWLVGGRLFQVSADDLI